MIIGLLVAGLALIPAAGAGALLAAIVAALLAYFGAEALSRRAIGGQTGDAAGFAQQVTELAIVLAVAAVAAPG